MKTQAFNPFCRVMIYTRCGVYVFGNRLYVYEVMTGLTRRILKE